MSVVSPDTQELIPGADELLPEPRPGGAHRRREWVDIVVGALRFRRTQVGLVIVAAIVLLALIGPFVAPHSPYATGIARDYSGPSAHAWLGTDGIGHDVFSRVLYGGRTVIGLSLAATVLAMIMGVALGLLAGYSRPAVDDVIMRLLDVLLAFPSIVFVLLLVALLGTFAVADRARRGGDARAQDRARRAWRDPRDRRSRLRASIGGAGRAAAQDPHG